MTDFAFGWLELAATLGLLAALLHVYFWVLESLTFTTKGHRVFGVPSEDVEAVRPWALNQGFYNLFLALGTATGAVLTFVGCGPVGAALVGFGTATMLGAALVLVGTDRALVRGALVQGTFPALALVALALAAL